LNLVDYDVTFICRDRGGRSGWCRGGH
jgi:hypothetical protein